MSWTVRILSPRSTTKMTGNGNSFAEPRTTLPKRNWSVWVARKRLIPHSSSWLNRHQHGKLFGRTGKVRGIGTLTRMTMMKPDEASTPVAARSCVAAWLSVNHRRLGLVQLKLEAYETPSKSLVAWFEAPGFFIDICVWEHQFAMDILVIDQRSGDLAFSAAGPCHHTIGLLERLSSFSRWAAGRIAGA